MTAPEDDGRPDYSRLAQQNLEVVVKALREGMTPAHAGVAASVAQVWATLELSHQVARVAAGLERQQERAARG